MNPPAAQVNPTVVVTVATPIAADSSVATAEPVAPPIKRRGRKRKVALDPKYHQAEYITMWPEICMGMKILIDRYDNVYTFDLEAPRWLGVKNLAGVIEKPATGPRMAY